jgi:hypothetical protein
LVLDREEKGTKVARMFPLDIISMNTLLVQAGPQLLINLPKFYD